MVPAARSPHKSAGPKASPEHRIEMLGLGLFDVGLEVTKSDSSTRTRVGVWTEEVDRSNAGEPSYWIHTLQAARSLIGPQTRLRFVIGSDQLIAFTRWREPREILRLADPVVLVRASDRRSGVVDEETVRALMNTIDLAGADSGISLAYSEAERSAFARGVILGQPLMCVSSTQVRALLASDNASPMLDEALTPSVLSHIRRHKLYQH